MYRPLFVGGNSLNGKQGWISDFTRLQSGGLEIERRGLEMVVDGRFRTSEGMIRLTILPILRSIV